MSLLLLCLKADCDFFFCSFVFSEMKRGASSALYFKMDHTALIKNEKIIPIILLKIDVTVCERFPFLIFKICCSDITFNIDNFC